MANRKAKKDELNVGIMSMQRILNYGSFMQALSLKKILEELGCNVTFVDYITEVCFADKDNKKEFIKIRIKNFNIVKKLLHKKHGYKPNVYDECYHMLGMTDKREYHKKVDMLVIGSDEVFNCLQSNRDVGFSMELFGKNCRAKKLISYAASFGDTTLERLNECGVSGKISKYLKKFDGISVRDANSLNVVRTLSSVEPSINFDPVLIGNVEQMQWKDIEESNFLIVYGYHHRFTEEEGKSIIDFARKKGLKVIGLLGEQLFCDENIVCRPDEVISYFKKAKYIITDTFHGVIFSVICHKQFVVFSRTRDNTRAGSVTNSEKLLDLIDKIDVRDRLILDLKHMPECLNEKIDYDKIDAIRTCEKKKSVEYLSKYIQEL